MKPGENRKLAACLDVLEIHGQNLQAVAQLLWFCGDLGNGAVVDAETVGRAGHLITQELKQMTGALEGLRKEIRRR